MGKVEADWLWLIGELRRTLMGGVRGIREGTHMKGTHTHVRDQRVSSHMCLCVCPNKQSIPFLRVRLTRSES